ncbi:MAG: hypothetical protein GVY29_05005 [Spirochaetes bacterium]|jgi:hypothetical protein|nr:hypothetical protein [Spirochaetota bacterium]
MAAYRDDIRAFYPYFTAEILTRALQGGGRVFLALRKLRVEGFAFYVPLGEIESVQDADVDAALAHVRDKLYPDQTLFMPVDYITRKYRDLGIAGKLYQELHRETPDHIKFLVFIVPTEARGTRRFLQRNDYEAIERFGRSTLFQRSL